MKSLVALLLLAAVSIHAAPIWIEGEDAVRSTARPHGWYNSVKKDELSGGDWLHHFSDAGPAEARYEFSADTAGDHQFWVRANPTGRAKLSWRLNGRNDWTAVDFSDTLDTANIASDGGIDLRYVAWVKVGTLTLPAGRSILEFRLHSANQNHGGLDCFVLSRQPFTPSGKLKPGQKLGLADPGTWAFEPGPDPLSPDALLDLSKLNEDTAGMHGFVAADTRGDFVDGRGKPLRFWAVNTGLHYKTTDPDTLRDHAKWLARRGVNMVRSHSHLLSKKDDAGITDVNPDELDRIRRLVAAMREEGIYTTISPYWAVACKYRPSLGLPDPDHGNLTGMLFWDETFQAAYKGWWKELLTGDNPHTGIPLARDPAVGLLQLQNEDSLLFYTLQAVKGEARRDLRKRFHAFLLDKHGSLDRARGAWGGQASHPNDAPDRKESGLFSVWHLTQNAKGATQNRYADQLEFYGRLMFDFNTGMMRYLREDLGCRHLINAGNWHTADAAKLYDIERWSYTANDVIGANRYFNGGSHTNPSQKGKAGWAITKGDIFNNRSVLRQPRRFPLAAKMPAGKPFIISESSWVAPLVHQSEGPFLVAAYSGLTGFDAYYWFSTGDAGYGRPIGKWQFSTPMLAGQFPAAAFLHRMGYVQRAKPVLHEHRTLDDLWQRRKPIAVEDSGYDPNRDPGTMNKLSAVKTPMNPLAYLAGPVEVTYDSDPKLSTLADFDVRNDIVTSLTGQLKWDVEAGICALDSPKAQGATGFLKGHPIRLSTIAIDSDNEYLTVLAVPLDGKDLAQSGKILVQLGTTTRPHGWRTEPVADGERITNLGGPPWNITRTKLRLSIKNPRLTKAIALDPNFLPTSELPLKNGSLTTPEDTLYLLLVE